MNEPERRLALIIGIGKYEVGKPLQNAENDAKAMASTLERIGFIVNGPNLNLTFDQMESTFLPFKQSIKKGDMVLFYFSGHGMQWEDQNFLIPTNNADLENNPDIRARVIHVQNLMNECNAKHPFATIFLLDCCRRYHLRSHDLQQCIARDGEEDAPASSRQYQIACDRGSLIAFACKPGTTADDGKGQNGLFTKHLLQRIVNPNEDIEYILRDVRKAVCEEANGKQIPVTENAVTGKNIFLCESKSISMLNRLSVLSDRQLIHVHVYKSNSANIKPIAKVKLTCQATSSDLLRQISAKERKTYSYLSIAGRPLHFSEEGMSIISAINQVRYTKTVFIQLPLCLMLHSEPLRSTNTPISGVDMKNDARVFIPQLLKSRITSVSLVPSTTTDQIHCVDNLIFTFPASCASVATTVEIRAVFSLKTQIFGLPECLCLFHMKIASDSQQLSQLPTVAFKGESDAYLYTLAHPSPYWITNSTRRNSHLSFDDIHAFVRHIQIYPELLTLPSYTFAPYHGKSPLIQRDSPITCRCLKVREHNSQLFPNVVYHGTSINKITSILVDGLVVPGTVVANGVRITPSAGHIPSGVEHLKIMDYADAVFVSPRIHYSMEPAFAEAFSFNNQYYVPVLECSVKIGAFQEYGTSLAQYNCHRGDNLNTIEWRVSNPTDIEVNAVLFIPVNTDWTDRTKTSEQTGHQSEKQPQAVQSEITPVRPSPVVQNDAPVSETILPILSDPSTTAKKRNETNSKTSNRKPAENNLKKSSGICPPTRPSSKKPTDNVTLPKIQSNNLPKNQPKK